jgi:hypothetical protein
MIVWLKWPLCNGLADLAAPRDGPYGLNKLTSHGGQRVVMVNAGAGMVGDHTQFVANLNADIAVCLEVPMFLAHTDKCKLVMADDLAA